MALVVCLVPIACGTADTAPPAGRHPATPGWFSDVTTETGLDFVHESGATGELHLPEAACSGAALFDADGDDDLDVYLTNADYHLNATAPGDPPPNRFYRHEAGLRFVDATAESGLGDTGYGMGVGVGDPDNDGDLDVYVANLGPDHLYLNRGDGRFEDATTAWGIDVPGFSSSVVFCDYDRDGFLDLYVAQYVKYDREQVCRDSSGRQVYCTPRAFTPLPDILLHNEAGTGFADVSRRAGLPRAVGAGLGVVCEDFDGDGLPDFYAANDQYANQLWINQGDGTFQDRALLMGAAYNLEGRAEAGMGVIAEDLDVDGDLDLFMTHLSAQSNTLYRNLGRGLFEDATSAAGLLRDSFPYTGFGTVALDAELDGDLDLLVANGRVLPAVRRPETDIGPPWDLYAEPNLFYLNGGGGNFELRQDLGDAFTRPVEVSRGLSAGDLDGDGDLDLLLSNIQHRARVYRNDAPREGNWLIVRAVVPELNRDDIGARVSVLGGKKPIVRTISTGFSYLTAHGPTAHVGLGDLEGPLEIEVRWLDGRVEVFDVPDVNRRVILVRGQGSPRP